VGRDLNVCALLTGRVAQRGDALRVQAELVEAASETQLWGERFQGKAHDIFDVEEEIARQISEKLRLKLTGQRRKTENIEAYHLYLKGRHHWVKRTKDGLKQAFDCFQQAIDTDPGYALPYSGLADCLMVMSFYNPSPTPAFLKRAKAAALRALEIDPELGEAYSPLGLIQVCLDWDWNAAEKGYRHAIALKPDFWELHTHFAIALSAMGRHEEAMQEVRRGLDLEPLAPVVSHHFAWVGIHAGRFEEAAERCRSALELDGGFPALRFWLGLALELQGRREEGIAEMEEGSRLLGTSFSRLDLARAYAAAGRTAEARGIVAEQQEAYERGQAEPYGFVLAYAALGETDTAFDWMERAFAYRSGPFAVWVNGDPRTKSLHSDPRMDVVLRRIGLTGHHTASAQG
jgi:tetratricopeptide (TPR) repeat protein